MTGGRGLLVGFLAIALGGCGDRGLTVTGRVALGGQPLSAGSIAFEPEANSGTVGAGAVADVKDGRFEVKSEKQLRPGKYLVRVSPASLGSGQDLRTAPPQFKAWETTVELPSGGPLQFDVPRQ